VKAIEESPGRAAEDLTQLFALLAHRFEEITDEELTKVTQRGERPFTAKRGLRRALEHPWEHLREIERRLATNDGQQ
jgi:hypothetical protein